MGTCLRSMMNASSPFSYTDNAEAATTFVDFSAADALEKNVALAEKQEKPLVIGTTGLSHKNVSTLKTTANKIPIFFSANFSLGIALYISTLKKLRKNLPPETQIYIEETHHLSKKDAPGGTALLLARSLDLPADHITSHRGDKTLFIHEVKLSFGAETLTLKHESFSRDVYARGALRAAEFILDKPPGLYTMEDLINEKA